MFEFIFHAFRNHTFLIFHNEMPASNHCLFAFDGCGNTVCHNIFNFGMHFLMNQMSVLSSIDHGSCHGMREMFLHTSCDTQKFICTHIFIKRNYIRYDWFGFCKCTCLIKYDSRSVCHSFHILAALDCNTVSTCLTDRRQYGNRHGKFQCTGKINHEYCQRLGYISGKQICYSCTCQSIRNQSVSQMFCIALCRRFQLLRILDHAYNLLIAAGTCHLSYFQSDLTLFQNGSRINITVLCLAHRL